MCYLITILVNMLQKNAKQLQEILAIKDIGLAPKQLNMFEGEL